MVKMLNTFEGQDGTNYGVARSYNVDYYNSTEEKKNMLDVLIATTAFAVLHKANREAHVPDILRADYSMEFTKYVLGLLQSYHRLFNDGKDYGLNPDSINYVVLKAYAVKNGNSYHPAIEVKLIKTEEPVVGLFKENEGKEVVSVLLKMADCTHIFQTYYTKGRSKSIAALIKERGETKEVMDHVTSLTDDYLTALVETTTKANVYQAFQIFLD